VNQVKADLISELIRVSQTNFLNRKRESCKNGLGDNAVVEWIQGYARSYREGWTSKLESYSTSELGTMLKALSNSSQSLEELLNIKLDKVET